ncbi:hypothetical protein ACCZ74_09435 [Agrobacterium vitis]|uniref:hypothetical protein n=1 Tax=Agrobacterium vitis TaxID=373 RepID=UPI00403E7AAB
MEHTAHTGLRILGLFVVKYGLTRASQNNRRGVSTILFGTFARFLYEALVGLNSPIPLASVSAFTFSLVLGTLWCLLGRRGFVFVLRKIRISHADEMPSAWFSLFSIKNVNGRQLSVKLTDGGWLHCEDLNLFANEPNGPCTLGNTGDVLMYVTHAKAPGATEFVPVVDTINTDWGTEVTYIPKDKIAYIDFRRSRR